MKKKFKLMSIQENYHKIKAQIPENVELVAVSKFHPVEKIKEVYDCGQKVLYGKMAKYMRFSV